ncbi:hypothetical protein NEOLEDRAFT_1136728 [Neolentinus lepideus HHB14362 ss-1]|uniref:Uncharacterized protein n=1 Tax=Neolentinus lepideus HHB14362 ss-1 TaxID=1314782 RepID=A0A165R619_9AGAM|nr:hypothetical protein NEOLEDRAFT_1136728 [Neolentinus lepideus HHB14362 ss-1]
MAMLWRKVPNRRNPRMRHLRLITPKDKLLVISIHAHSSLAAVPGAYLVGMFSFTKYDGWPDGRGSAQVGDIDNLCHDNDGRRPESRWPQSYSHRTPL